MTFTNPNVGEAVNTTGGELVPFLGMGTGGVVAMHQPLSVVTLLGGQIHARGKVGS